MSTYRILLGDVRETLRTLPDASVQCAVTSPPYWGLRDYGHPGQLGLEPTPEEYVGRMVEVFREVRRVLRPDGTLWLNLGDSYAGNRSKHRDVGNGRGMTASRRRDDAQIPRSDLAADGCKPKDLVGIPWRVAFALQADGWWLRCDIIWCLSGGTWVYARTQKGEGPIMVRDLARLNPASVRLWNGRRWTQLLGMSKSPRCGDEIELVLRSGERISCTPTHRFPTNRGLLTASEIRVGDVLESCTLPEPEEPKRPEHIGLDAAWFAGLYIAEGSRSGDTIQIAGHANEHGRWHRIREIAEAYGGSAHRHIYGNTMHISVHGKLLNAIIDTLVSGRTAKDKCFSPVVWRYSNDFIAAMLRGYLEGDGHWDPMNGRWRIAFARNYNLERDLRTACARLGYPLTLKLSHATYKGRKVPTFRGEIREHATGHHNERPRTEVVEIRRARCREVYDLGVADEPHLFALASGVLTHNSKPNPMPESVTDRPTKAHEYVFLLSKSERYFYDADAIAEPAAAESAARYAYAFGGGKNEHLLASDQVHTRLIGKRTPKTRDGSKRLAEGAIARTGGLLTGGTEASTLGVSAEMTRNARTVWTIATQPYPGAHFATFPPELAERCIKAGSRPGDTVLDPFAGSGTTGMVATGHGRRAILCEINPEYAALIRERCGPMLEAVA